MILTISASKTCKNIRTTFHAYLSHPNSCPIILNNLNPYYFSLINTKNIFSENESERYNTYCKTLFHFIRLFSSYQMPADASKLFRSQTPGLLTRGPHQQNSLQNEINFRMRRSFRTSDVSKLEHFVQKVEKKDRESNE